MRGVSQVLGRTGAISAQVGANAVNQKQRQANVDAAFRERCTRFRVLEEGLEFTKDVVYFGSDAC